MKKSLAMFLAVVFLFCLLPVRGALAEREIGVMVFVNGRGTEYCYFSVNFSVTVGYFKSLIQYRLGVPPDTYVLKYLQNGSYVLLDNDDRTLSEYGVWGGSIDMYMDPFPENADYTVTLDPGDGSGMPIVYRLSDQTTIPTEEDAENLEFYLNSDGLIGFRLPPNYCPPSFAAPDNYDFWKWTRNGSVTLLWETTTITAEWKEGQIITNGRIEELLPADGTYFYLGGILWHVIGMDGSDWLAISEDLLGEPLNWEQASDYCDTVYDDFSAPEQSAIIPTTKTDQPTVVSHISFNSSALEGAEVFLLSAAEAAYYFRENSDRLPGHWWLRSRQTNVINGGFILSDGSIATADIGCNTGNGARPAFRFDADSVVIWSSAEGGKSSYAENGGSFGYLRNVGHKKATIYDSERQNFYARFTSSVTTTAGGTLTVSYSGAPTGENEYVSALFEVGGKIYYASTASEGTGSWQITLPRDIQPGDYVMKLFCEQKNGDLNTDYSSKFTKRGFEVRPFEIKFKNGGSVLETVQVGAGHTPVYSGSTPVQESSDPYVGYVFEGWNHEIVPAYSDAVYTAVFRAEPKHLVHFEANGGTGSMEDDYYFEYLGTYTLPTCAFTPPEGYAFKRWIVSWENPETNQGNYSWHMAGGTLTNLQWDIIVEPEWEESPVLVSVMPQGAGTAVFDSSQNIFTAEANEGYTFDHWEYVEEPGMAVPIGVDLTISEDNPFTPETVAGGLYTAYFIRNEYPLDVYSENSEKGTVSYTGTPETGRRIRLTAAANEGFSFREWIADPEDLEIDSNNRFYMPPCPVTVVGIFTASDEFVVKYVDEDGRLMEYYVVNSLDEAAFAGDLPSKVTDDGFIYVFAGWTPSTDETGDVTYTATFQKIKDYTCGIASVSVTSFDAGGETVFTVGSIGDKPCAVGVLNQDGTIEKLSCTTEDGVHGFTLASGGTIVVTVRGDTDLNGELKGKDSTMLKRFLAGSLTLTNLQIFACDVDGNGSISGRETTLLARVIAGSAAYNW